MGLSPKTLHALSSLRYMEATEVQQKVIPTILAGKNVMVRSQTGTGKTAAFGIAMVERLVNSRNRKGLVLSPTRELAMQICTEIKLIASFYRMRILVVYGGQSINKQINELRRGVDILVATPGRLLDLSRRNQVNIREFDFIVLDEADRMLDMGFVEDIDQIMQLVSKKNMTHLFSATLDQRVHKIASRYIQNPEVIEVGLQEAIAEIEEQNIHIPRNKKFAKLKEIIRSNPNEKMIIFGATKRIVDFLWKKLNEQGINAGSLHGDMSQSKRTRTMDLFKKGKFNIMIATDVAARGIHVEDIGIIVNYDEAMDADTHLHRIGRTGRMGKKGKAITFIETHDEERPAYDADYRDLLKQQRRRRY